MYLGQYNHLKINRFSTPGAYLIDEEENEVLLPNKYLKEEFKEGDEIDVFVYKDSENRLVAVTDIPLIQLHGFAYLECFSVTHHGAFVDWGMEKHLFVPYAEQAYKMEEGNSYIIHLDIDEATQRLYGSSRYEKFLEKEHLIIENGEEVDLLVAEITDLGCKVIINDTYGGLIFKNQITKPLFVGSTTKGYVKEIRPDGKIDITLEPQGYRNKITSHTDIILDYLEQNNGISKITDKSSSEEIMHTFGMSKKAFKQAIGHLYKQRIIQLQPGNIQLVK